MHITGFTLHVMRPQDLTYYVVFMGISRYMRVACHIYSQLEAEEGQTYTMLETQAVVGFESCQVFLVGKAASEADEIAPSPEHQTKLQQVHNMETQHENHDHYDGC